MMALVPELFQIHFWNWLERPVPELDLEMDSCGPKIWNCFPNSVKNLDFLLR